MGKTLALILFLMLSKISFANSKVVITKTRQPAEIETLASWKMIAPDKQTFSLHEDKYEDQVTSALTFSIGEKNQRTFPVDKPKWDKWRTRLVHLVTTLNVGKRCPHPLRFEIKKKDAKEKSKNVCLDEVTESERNEIQKLANEWNEYLYGKE